MPEAEPLHSKSSWTYGPCAVGHISNEQSLPCRFQVCVGGAEVVVVWLILELLLRVGWSALFPMSNHSLVDSKSILRNTFSKASFSGWASRDAELVRVVLKLLLCG